MTTRNYFIKAGGDDGQAGDVYNNSGTALVSGLALDENDWFFRFQDFSIFGNDITKATLRVTTANTVPSSSFVLFDVYGEKSLNPSQIVSTPDYNSRQKTTATTQFRISTGSADRKLLIDITDIIQEIVNQNNFVTDQAIQLLFDYNSSSGGTDKRIYAFETSQLQAATLTVEFNTTTLIQPLEFYLVPIIGETVFTGRVNGAPSDPYVELGYDTGVTGSFGYPLAGQTIWIGSTSGANDRGKLRLRNAFSAVSGTMDIGESDDVGPLIQNDDFITIKNEFRLWPRFPQFLQQGANVTIFEDWDIAFTNQTNQWRPQAVAGPPGVAFLESSTVSINFVGDRSYALAPGATITAYSWTALGSVEGTSSSQGTEASPVTFTWSSPGKYLVSLTVTDSNGNTDINHTWAIVINPNNPTRGFLDFDVTNDSLDFDQGGGECGFTVFGDASVDQFPQDCQILHVARGNVSSNNTWPFRDNLLFNGWIINNSIRQSPITGDVSFRASTIDGVMKTLSIFPISLTDKISPNDWTQGKNLTVDRVASFLYKYRSTLGLMTSIIPVNWTGLIKRQDTGASNLYNEVRSNLMQSIAGGFGRLTSSHQGVLYHTIDYNVMTTAERSAINTGKTLHKGVWINNVNIDEMSEYTRPVKQVKSSGVLYPGGEVEDICPLFSEAPGNAPKPYGNEQSFDRQILISQTDLNIRTGHAFVKLNHTYNPYRIQFINDLDFATVPQKIYPSIIESGDNDRQLSLNGQLRPKRISRQFDHSNGTFIVSIDFEPVSSGVPGQTVTVDCDPPKEESTVQPEPPTSPPQNSPSNALIAGTTGTSYYYQPGIQQTWQRRVTGLVDPDQLGFLDLQPDPWSTFKQGYNPDKTIVWGAGKGFLVRTTDSGKNWGNRTNYLEPGPGATGTATSDLDILRVETDIFREDRLYLLATWQATGTYQTAIAKSIDGFDYDWYSITGTQVRGYGLSVDKGSGEKLYATTWEGSGPTGTIYLNRFDPETMTLQEKFELGYGAEVDSNLYYAHPLNRLGQSDEVFAFGRMLEPQGFTGISQILRNIDCGNTGSYSIIVGWGTSYAGAVKVAEDATLYSVRQDIATWSASGATVYSALRIVAYSGFVIMDATYGLLIDGTTPGGLNFQRVYRVELATPTVGTAVNFDTSGDLGVTNTVLTRISDTKALGTWTTDNNPVLKATVFTVANPPTFGAFIESTIADVSDYCTNTVLSATRGLACGQNDVVLLAIGATTVTEEDTDTVTVGDIVGLGNVSSTDGIVIEAGSPANAYIIETTPTTITTSGASALTGVNISAISTCKPVKACLRLDDNRVLLAFHQVTTNNLCAIVLSVSGTTVTPNTITVLDPAFDPDSIDLFTAGSKVGVMYGNGTEIKFRTITVQDLGITDNNDASIVDNSGNRTFYNGGGYHGNDKIFANVVADSSFEGEYIVLTGQNTDLARFYLGTNFKFGLPYPQVKARALAVSGNDGIVAIGAGGYDPVVTSASPYVTGVANDASMGQSVSALWWL